MNLRDIEKTEETADAKTIIQKSNQPSPEQMMLSKVRELTEALENSRSLLQEEKEEKEGYLQELETEKKRNSNLFSQNTKLRKMLEESQSTRHCETQKLQEENRILRQENDDLRNNEGLNTREEIESILKKDKELEDAIAKKDKLLNTSVVEAVERAERAEKFAEVACKYFREGAGERVREIEELCDRKLEKAAEEARKVTKIAKDWMEISEQTEKLSRKVIFISCGILCLFILLESVFHREFWKDLFEFFFVPGKWVFNQWVSAASKAAGAIGLLPMLGRIGITLAVTGALASIVWMTILTVKHRCWLTVVVFVVSLEIAVILGDFLPFNRIIPVFAVMLIYHLIFWIINRKKHRSVSKKKP